MSEWLRDDDLIQNGYALLSELSLRQYEAELGFSLPEEYRQFLLWQNGGECPDYVRAGDSHVDSFFSLQNEIRESSLVENRGGWDNLFPSVFLGIADTSCGDYFCIHRDSGQIYFLFHDDPFQDYSAKRPQADSLKNFLLSLSRELPSSEPEQSLPAFEAVRTGNRKVLQSLLESNTEANATNERGTYLLHYAIRLWRRGMISDLLAAGADIEAAEPDGETALFCAGSAQVVDIGRSLIAAGANLDATDARGNSVLMHAINRGNVRLAIEIIQAGANVNHRAPDGRSAADCCTNHSSRQYVLPHLRRS